MASKKLIAETANTATTPVEPSSGEVVSETPAVPTTKPKIDLDFNYDKVSAKLEVVLIIYLFILIANIVENYPLGSSGYGFVILLAGVGAVAWIGALASKQRPKAKAKARVEPLNSIGSILITLGIITLAASILPDVWTHGLVISTSLGISLLIHLRYLKISKSPRISLNTIALGVLTVMTLIIGTSPSSMSEITPYMFIFFISAFITYYLTRYIVKRANLPKELNARGATDFFTSMLVFLHIGPFLVSLVQSKNITSPLFLLYPVLLIAAYIHSLAKLSMPLFLVVNISFAILLGKVVATPFSIGHTPPMDTGEALGAALFFLILFLPISFGIFYLRSRLVRRAALARETQAAEESLGQAETLSIQESEISEQAPLAAQTPTHPTALFRPIKADSHYDAVAIALILAAIYTTSITSDDPQDMIAWSLPAAAITAYVFYRAYTKKKLPLTIVASISGAIVGLYGLLYLYLYW